MTLSSQALAALPVFPLPGIVLLPGGLLPLHIFEPRYRAMTEDALAGDKLIAMARVHDVSSARPVVPRVLGVGAIIAADRLPDGRFRILLHGEGRVLVDEELPQERLYRRVRAHQLVDLPGTPTELIGRHEHLISLCDRVAQLVDGGGDELRELARKNDEPGACADLLAAALLEDVDARQFLLEELDPAVRLDTVAAHVASLLITLAPSDGVLN